eukprot:3129065-Lingulodinium_polyedra.AAC.1
MFYTGSNRGKCWTNIIMEPIDMVWQLPHAEKMACLGQAVRPVGGRPREDANLLIADTPEDEEPM